MIRGDIRARGSVTIGSASTVWDVTSGSTVTVQTGAKVRKVTPNTSVPSVSLTTKTVTVGTLDVVLQNPPNCTQQIAAGNYRNITVNQGCRLKLSPGNYNANSVTIQAGGALELLGTVTVNTNGSFQFGDRATLAGATSPNSLSVYSNQSVRIGTDTSFKGMILAPNGDATVASRTAYSGCVRARRTSIEPDVGITGIADSTCDPALNSVDSAHGNTDWHIDTANAFLYGVDMSGSTWAVNHAPDSWTKRHLHVGASNTAKFYQDATVDAAGQDTNSSSGIDKNMLFFYAGHGNPDGFNTLGDNASPLKMRLGNCGNGSHLRYYWQCSCEVFAHGPVSCPSGGWAYSCPGLFDGSADSYAMRNVYQRWGGAVDAGYLRMACGASTEAYCWGPQANQIWDNYLNLGMDVADSFIHGLHNEPSSTVVPLCLTTGDADVTKTPLYDRTFTNQANLGGDYYHLQYMDQFASRTSASSGLAYSFAELPVLDVIPSTGLSRALSARGFAEEGAYYVSTQAVAGREARVLIHKETGATYYRGDAGAPVALPSSQSSDNYVAEASNLVSALGWTEPTTGSSRGTRTIIARQSKNGGAVALFQKNVAVTIPRTVEINGAAIPVLGDGGRMVIHLNNDGSIRNASKVWRRTAPGAVLPLKPYTVALSEAMARIDNPADYRLDSWEWGYKEDAGTVAQQQLKIVLQFRFVSSSHDSSSPPRIIEIQAQ